MPIRPRDGTRESDMYTYLTHACLEWADNIANLVNGSNGNDDKHAHTRAHKKMTRVNVNRRWREIIMDMFDVTDSEAINMIVQVVKCI